MTDDWAQRAIDRSKRIAAARANRTPVDSDGNPTGERATFTYDELGKLVAVDPAPADKAGGTDGD